MILAFPSFRVLQGAKRGPATALSPMAVISHSLLYPEIIGTALHFDSRNGAER